MHKKLSEKTINRLSLYHSILVDHLEKGLETIVSPYIASLLNIDDSQVRKDINCINNIGKGRVGYSVKGLKECIEKTLGFEKTKDVFIVGAGNLGLALAKYDNFENYGVNVLALFDNDPLKVDLSINNKQVFHISKLSDLTESLNVEIAILTVPRIHAQKTADILVAARIKYIWNFTPTVLKVPPEVQVWHENLMGNFLQFTYLIQKK